MNRSRIILLFSVLCFALSGFSENKTFRKNDDKGNQRAYYECSQPMDIDSSLFVPEPGKVYFHFNKALKPSGLAALGFGWTEDNPKDYFTGYLINTSDSTFNADRQ